MNQPEQTLVTGSEVTLRLQDRAVAHYAAKTLLGQLGMMSDKESFSYDDVLRAVQISHLQAIGLSDSIDWPQVSLKKEKPE